MYSPKNSSIFLLRLSLGILFFYAGISKVLDPNWTAAGYLSNAKTFPEFFVWFAQPENIGWVNFLNEWGLTLIGVALILGIFTRYASWAAIILLLLYYLPVLDSPLVGEHGYIVDEHIVYIAAFLVLIQQRAGRIFGLDAKL